MSEPAATGNAMFQAPTNNSGETMASERMMLWVDGVGGFLVLLKDEIELGQAVPDASVDVPILGDLSRRHATIRRLGESYVVEPLGPVAVNGRPVAAATLLAHGDEIQLGRNVKLRFAQPHPLSATARLDLIDRRRTEPACDAIVLMARSLVLGPGGKSHIVCRRWSGEVVLHRQGDELICRAAQPFAVDGRVCGGRALVAPHSQVQGEDFSLSLEDVQRTVW